MQYQNHTPRTAWNNHRQGRQGGLLEIAGIAARPGHPEYRGSRFRPARPARSSFDRDRWQHSIERAITAAMEQLLEGLVLYAASMQPGSLLLLEDERVDAAASSHGSGRVSPTLAFREAPAASPATPYEPRAGGSVGPSQLTKPVRPSWTAWILAIPRKLWSALLSERDFRRTRNSLQALDDRMLKDVGLSRCEIYRVARQGRPCD
jgi:uncharacterized protein YjiS (DUF1127 family)